MLNLILSVYKNVKLFLSVFGNNENGDYVVELSILFPVIIIIAMFFVDNNLYYDGLIMTSTSANEALRYAITAENEAEAIDVIRSTLGERAQQAKLGWCNAEGTAHCSQWRSSIRQTTNRSTFNGNSNYNLLIDVDDAGWCNGSYITIGVRTHKASLIPSFSTFRRIMTDGGSIYHEYTYTFKARIESNYRCS